MNDDLKNNVSVDNCKDCKKSPCICSKKSESLQKKTAGDDDKTQNNKPPKISWIGL